MTWQFWSHFEWNIRETIEFKSWNWLMCILLSRFNWPHNWKFEKKRSALEKRFFFQLQNILNLMETSEIVFLKFAVYNSKPIEYRMKNKGMRIYFYFLCVDNIQGIWDIDFVDTNERNLDDDQRSLIQTNEACK